MTSARILLVDDFFEGRETLSHVLEKNGFDVRTASNGREAMAAIEAEQPQLILLDVNMPEMDGYEVTRALKGDVDRRAIPIILLTANDSSDDIVKGLEIGADDYLTKPIRPEELIARVKASLRLRSLYEQLRTERTKSSALAESLGAPYRIENIIGKSPLIVEIGELVRKVAPADSVVLITGASGTGKELVARAIHYNSNRKTGPFVAKNCAAFQETLIEAELFGYVKGAFTGATRDAKGLLEAAAGGTLFLDEVGDLPLSLQAKLLRVLQEGTYTPVGSTVEKSASVRFLAATNRSLPDMVEKGLFREDLYYRLSVITMQLPTLAERREDIPLLAEHFLGKFCQEKGLPRKSFSNEVLEILSAYSWRGNIRELQNEIERLIVLSGDSVTLGSELLSPKLRLQERNAVAKPIASQSLRTALDEVERALIRQTLLEVGGNKSKAARMLGISRSNLIAKVQAFHLEEEN